MVPRRRFSSRLWRSLPDYVFLIPGLVIFGAFIVWPIIASQYYALLNWRSFGSVREFIGLGNFEELLRDEFFLRSLGRTILFAVATVPFQMLLGLVLAILLNNRMVKLPSLFRTLIFLPVVTPVAVVAVIFVLLMSPFNGAINNLLLDTGIVSRSIDFLGTPSLVLWSLAGIYVWKWTGVTLIYWLAALQTVPSELYEAARMDGVKPVQFTLHVIMPLLAPFAMVIALISTISALNVFPLVQATTQGGPYFSSEVMEVFIFRTAFGTSPRLGYASAAGVLFGLAIMALTILQILMVSRARRRKAGHD